MEMIGPGTAAGAMASTRIETAWYEDMGAERFRGHCSAISFSLRGHLRRK
ncbi:hypothetical protein [Burkholderia sp. Ac-20353]|nr:hypothetical protein [Burkholderia sp. Ac-20353]MBN3787570.1 hypothetical protein [Burkholderia sp. Ac-20353]